ncbi:hypothetical protein ACPA0F_09115 [Solibacillus silvestris]
MKSQLINVLETFCPDNVYLQGTFSENDSYPDEFITFWTNYTDDRAFYDDDVHSTDWQFSVIYYSADPADMPTVPESIISALKAAGFKPQGKGRDVPCDRPTHTGWAMEFIKVEYV